MKRQSAFTLLELLIVIAIIGVMATFLVGTLQGPQQSARDARRKSDLKQFQVALELYANKNGTLYPNYSGSGVPTTTLCTTLATGNNCTDDPVSTKHYTYVSTAGSGASGTPTSSGYVLYATLDRKSEYWVVCSDSSLGSISTSSWTPSATCPTGLTP